MDIKFITPKHTIIKGDSYFIVQLTSSLCYSSHIVLDVDTNQAKKKRRLLIQLFGFGAVINV